MASSIVNSAAQQLGALLVEEAKYLYAVSDKIERLQSELAWMQCFLEDADNRQHREKVVAMWVNEIRDFAYEAEDLIERYVHEVSPRHEYGIWNTIRWSLFVLADALTLHDVGSSIDDLRTRITELVSRLQIYGIQIIRQSDSEGHNFAMTLREQRRTYSHIEEDPVGLEEHIKEVVDQLVSNNGVKVVGICGMGGLGKTTLARKAEIQGVSLDDIAEMYLNELVKRCMVQVEKSWPNGRIKTCRLHDVMRDMCLNKCKEVNFLCTVEHGSSSELSHYTRSSSLVNRKLRRCVVYLRDGGCGSPFRSHQNESSYIRSLLVFPYGSNDVRELVSQDMGKFFSLLRVLDIERASILDFPRMTEHLIHLRYLSLRRTWVSFLHPCIWDCKYLETLDLRSRILIRLSNGLWKLERLRHLYLPRQLVIEDAEENEKLILTHNQSRQMETLKNLDVNRCRIEDLAKMPNLRIFSFTRKMEFISKEVLEVLLESPVIATERLVNLLRLDVRAETINEEPTILTPLKSYPCISVSLQISGRIEVAFDGSIENTYSQIFPHNLTRVQLKDCEIISEGISVLEKLPLLEELVLEWKAVRGNKMSFSDGSFRQLVELRLDDLEGLEEWEVGEGALPNLRYLEIWWCKKLKMIPEGLPTSVQIQCYNPCIKGIHKYNTCPHFS